MTRKRAVAVVYVGILFVTIMDATIVNVALPALGRQFGVPATSADGVVVGYLVALAVAMPVSGWLGDRLGTKRLFLIAIATFAAASGLCAAAQSLPELVALRVVQGAGAGLLTPVGLTLLFRTFPEEERVRIGRLLMVPTVVAPATGPVLGGFLVDTLSWRWAFGVNVPLGLAALLFGWRWLAPGREHAPGRFDLPGFALAAAAMALLMYALSRGAAAGWTSAAVVLAGLGGLAALLALVAVERRAAAPLLDLRLLRERRFATALGVMATSSVSFGAVLYLVPVFVQDARGASALSSGLTTAPEALGVVCSTQLVARLYPRVGPRRLMAVGQVALAVAVALLGATGLGTGRAVLMALMFLVGAAAATEMLPAQTAAFEGMPAARTSAASTLYNVGNRLAGALGVALVSSVVVAIGPFAHGGQPHAVAYRAAFLAAAAIALLGAAIALAVPTRRPAPAAPALEPSGDSAAQDCQ